jgi:hypothetical protein
MTTVSEGDRELLELAAKAAGYSIVWGEVHRVGDTDVDCTDLAYIVSSDREEAPVYWNPWDDDGDAFRLAVKCGFCVGKAVQAPQRFACPQETDDAFYVEENGDPYAATRRAIVLAAASIGKSQSNGRS